MLSHVDNGTTWPCLKCCLRCNVSRSPTSATRYCCFLKPPTEKAFRKHFIVFSCFSGSCSPTRLAVSATVSPLPSFVYFNRSSAENNWQWPRLADGQSNRDYSGTSSQQRLLAVRFLSIKQLGKSQQRFILHTECAPSWFGTRWQSGSRSQSASRMGIVAAQVGALACNGD